jgi:two-component system, NarL family, nitrate/nitrite response regulator NarL
MRLVLCDDQRIFGEALAVALEARGHRVLAITTAPGDGVAAVAAYQPDVCLLDLHFFGRGSGLDAARAMHQHQPGTRVLVLSAVTDPAALAEARDAGVAGFIRKDQNVDEIAHALDVIAAGGSVFYPVGGSEDGGRAARPRRRDPLSELTQREKEVLMRVAAGESTKQIAHAMNITTNTVRTYVKNVLTKLGLHSRLQLAALASREGLLGDPPPRNPPP